MKTAIISGVTGQDGSYLSEYLLEKKYQVIGFSRRTASHSTDRIDHIINSPNFKYLEGDVTDSSFIWSLISKYKPDHFYNLAAQSHVHTSFENPYSTFQIDTMGVLNTLDAIRSISPKTRFYQAGTSELFGSSFTLSDKGEKYQDENTCFVPNSPYAVAKLAAHHLVRLYRESYGLFACSGVLFNHESPRRGENFVTQKIVKWIVEFDNWRYLTMLNADELTETEDGLSVYGRTPNNAFPKLRLGNLDSCRDWGHAKDYIKAMFLMLNRDAPDDFVVGSGRTHTIRDFLSISFSKIGVKSWDKFVLIDQEFIRPAEVPYLKSNPVKAKTELQWEPQYSLEELIAEMIYEERLRRPCV